MASRMRVKGHNPLTVDLRPRHRSPFVTNIADHQVLLTPHAVWRIALLLLRALAANGGSAGLMNLD
jgi:hypothetical protein